MKPPVKVKTKSNKPMAYLTLSLKKIQELSAPELLEPQNVEAVKYAGYYYIESLDFDSALALAGELEQKLVGVKPNTQDEKYYYYILRYWANRLKIFAFRSLSLKEQVDFFKEHTVEALENYLDLKAAVLGFIDVFGTESIIRGYAKNFVTSLSGSITVLGKNIAAFQQKAFKPTVGNWLREYQFVLKPAATGMKLQPGTFHIVKFMDTNQYVKFLSKSEKETLRALLDLYNWLLDPIIFQEDASQGNKLPIVSREKYRLPENLQSQPAPRNMPPIKAPPAQSLPKPFPIKPLAPPAPALPQKPLAQQPVKPVPIIAPPPVAPKAPQPTQSQNFVQAQNVQPPRPPLPTLPPKQVNIQDILNRRNSEDQRGITGSDFKAVPTVNASTIAEQIENKRRKNQAEIDKKLEELKKKLNKNDNL